MNPASMCSPRSMPPPAATSAAVEAEVPLGASDLSAAWMTGSPAWKSTGAPAIVSVFTRSGRSAA